MDLKKKVGPLPLWAWVLVVGGIGYLAWKRAQSGESEGVEEGIYPTNGLANEPAAGTSTGGSGAVTAAEEFGNRAEEAAETRAIASQEAAEGRGYAHEEAVEDRTVAREEAAEGRASALELRGLSLEEGKLAAEELMAKATGNLAKAQAVKNKREAQRAASKKHRQGKGAKKGGKKNEKVNGNKGQAHHSNKSNHQPGHVKKTDHRTAAPARARVSHPKAKPKAKAKTKK